MIKTRIFCAMAAIVVVVSCATAEKKDCIERTPPHAVKTPTEPSVAPVAPKKRLLTDVTRPAKKKVQQPAMSNPHKQIIFNNVVTKPKEDMDDAQLSQLAEQTTGQKVAEIRHGAIGMRLVRFEPLVPPRDEAAQAELVRRMALLDVFQYVERDKWLTLKGSAPKRLDPKVQRAPIEEKPSAPSTQQIPKTPNRAE